MYKNFSGTYAEGRLVEQLNELLIIEANDKVLQTSFLAPNKKTETLKAEMVAHRERVTNKVKFLEEKLIALRKHLG